MTTINQLPLQSSISGSDQLAAYSAVNGDTRRVPVSSLLTYFQSTFASPTMATTYITPGTGFNYSVPTPSAAAQWILIQPAGGLADGTVTLPLASAIADGLEVLITTTQQIAAFVIALNGAAQLFGNVTALSAGDFVKYRYYADTNSWYRIG